MTTSPPLSQMTLQNGVHIRQEAAKQPSSQPVRQSRTGGESKQRDWPWPGPETETVTEAESESGSECMLADKRMLIGAARLANCGGSRAFLSRQAKRAVRLASVSRPSVARLTVMTVKSN